MGGKGCRPTSTTEGRANFVSCRCVNSFAASIATKLPILWSPRLSLGYDIHSELNSLAHFSFPSFLLSHFSPFSPFSPWISLNVEASPPSVFTILDSHSLLSHLLRSSLELKEW